MLSFARACPRVKCSLVRWIAQISGVFMFRAEANMQFLERRPTGPEAEREVRKKIRDFMEGDRTDISLRDEFNNWLFREESALSLIPVSAQHFLVGLRSYLTARLLVSTAPWMMLLR